MMQCRECGSTHIHKNGKEKGLSGPENFSESHDEQAQTVKIAAETHCLVRFLEKSKICCLSKNP